MSSSGRWLCLLRTCCRVFWRVPVIIWLYVIDIEPRKSCKLETVILSHRSLQLPPFPCLNHQTQVLCCRIIKKASQIFEKGFLRILSEEHNVLNSCNGYFQVFFKRGYSLLKSACAVAFSSWLPNLWGFWLCLPCTPTEVFRHNIQETPDFQNDKGTKENMNSGV